MSRQGRERSVVVAVVGNSRLEEGDPFDGVAFALGRGIVDAGWTLVTGGLGGVMAAASRGGRESRCWTKGSIVGLLPGHDPDAANQWVDVAIPTGLDLGRNLIVAHADAVVAVGGEAGTLSEIALAWQLHRLIVAIEGRGWAGRLAGTAVDSRCRYPDTAADMVRGAPDARSAIALLQAWLPRYRRIHHGVSDGQTGSRSDR